MTPQEAAELTRPPLFGQGLPTGATPTPPDADLQVLPSGAVLDAAISPDGERALVLVHEDVLSLWRLAHPHLFKLTGALLALMVIGFIAWRWRPGRRRRGSVAGAAVSVATVLVLWGVVGYLLVASPPREWGQWLDLNSATAFEWLGPSPHFSRQHVWTRRVGLWEVDLATGDRLATFDIPDNLRLGGAVYSAMPVSQIGYAADGRHLIVTALANQPAGRRRVVLIDRASSAVVAEWSTDHLPSGAARVTSVRLRPDGSFVDVLQPLKDGLRFVRLSTSDLTVVDEFRATTADTGSVSEAADRAATVPRASSLDQVAPLSEADALRVLHHHTREDGHARANTPRRWQVTDLRYEESPVVRQLSGDWYNGWTRGGLSPDGRFAWIELGEADAPPPGRFIIGGPASPVQIWRVNDLMRLLELPPVSPRHQVELLDGYAMVAAHASGQTGWSGLPPATAHLYRLSLEKGAWSGPRVVPLSWPAYASDLTLRWPPPDIAFMRHAPDSRRSVVFTRERALVIDW